MSEHHLRSAGVLAGWTAGVPACAFLLLLLFTPAALAQTTFFPADDVFQQPLADQKQPRTHVTWQRYALDFGDFNIGSVGYGANFGIVRFARPAGAMQFGIDGSVQAIFNLDSESMDLINADYFVGLPLTYRRGASSGRVRLFHLSSHLGDEFLLLPQPIPQPPRKNLSFEAVELLLSWERAGIRVYGGGFAVMRSTEPLRQTIRPQAGVEYRRALPRGFGFLSGVDVARAAKGGANDVSVKAGVQLPAASSHHTLQFLGEYYDGRVPHGQFFEEIGVRYFGAGVVFVY